MVGEGVFIGNAEDSYVFQVGNPDGDYFAWDENGIDIAGDWIAGWTIRPKSLSSGSGGEYSYYIKCFLYLRSPAFLQRNSCFFLQGAIS